MRCRFFPTLIDRITELKVSKIINRIACAALLALAAPLRAQVEGNPGAGVDEASLRRYIGAMIMVGFHGTKPADEWPQKLAEQIRTGSVGGVVLYKYNIENKDQVIALNHFLLEVRAPAPLLIAVDEEGGKVQRLNTTNGFKGFMAAKDMGNAMFPEPGKEVAQSMTPEQAKAYYRDMGLMLKEAGFNLDLGPVVDVDYTPPCPVIGGLGRSFSDDPKHVAECATAMRCGLNEAGVLSCLKHFPGHGSAQGDTHMGLVDISKTWSAKRELQAFYDTLQRTSGGPSVVMTAHIMNSNLDNKYPATLSPVIIKQQLRDKVTDPDLIVISDDMHMGAIIKNYGFEEAVVAAINAEVDILLFSNNQAAAKGVEGFQPDPDLPSKVADIIVRAVKDGRIKAERLKDSYQRITNLKAKLRAQVK